MTKKKLNNRQHIMARYGCIVVLFLFGCICIIGKLAMTSLVNASVWRERAAKQFADSSFVEPTRGSILSANGNILACNRTLYDVRFDIRHPKFTKLKPEAWVKLDSLADSLDTYYPRIKGLDKPIDKKDKSSWHQIFKTEFSIQDVKSRRGAITVGTKLTLEEYERIRRWPFLNDIPLDAGKYKCPLYKEEKIIRVYPFGDVARLSIGRVYEDVKTGKIKGYAGLEMALDSLLYGKPGVTRKKVLTNGLTDWVTVPPVRGYDILTTIDIDMQDILEGELLNMCDSIDAYWGTAVLMEVSTGEIKAISNVERDSTTGKYIEAMNRAIIAYEPGSVMKTISLMVAFEDGIVKSVTDTEDCSAFMGTSDHAGAGRKTLKQIIETSSNPGIARVIFRKYADNPQGFRNRLEQMGFFEPMRTGIGGEMIPRIPKIVSTRNGKPVTQKAQHMDLARQAYGYNTAIPPMYTLAYYNAIANGGRMVRPHLVRALRDEDGKDSVLRISYIRDPVCSPKTANMLKECLHEVVWGKRGTGRALQDDRVAICGKTGTAIPHIEDIGYDKTKRRYAFCGFFPYDNPKYSCIVLMTVDAGVASAARSSGRVLLNTALKLFARGLLNDVSSSYSDASNSSTAQLYGDPGSASFNVTQTLGIINARQFKTAPAEEGKVPNVVGMDISSAIRTLEKCGISVSGIKGFGYVKSQSLTAGLPLAKKQHCTLWLQP